MGLGEKETVGRGYPMIEGRVSTGVSGGGGKAEAEEGESWGQQKTI